MVIDMLKYKVGDVVRHKCYRCEKITSGRIIKTDTYTSLVYLIKCCNCTDTCWYPKRHVIGLDYTYKPKWDALPDDCVAYCENDVEVLNKMFSRMMCTGTYLPKIKKVIFNNPATIVFWKDGTKTVVKARAVKSVKMAKELFHKMDTNEVVKFIGLKSGQIYKAFYKGEIDAFIIDIYDEFDPEKGLAMAIAKKALGNNYHYYNEFKKWLPKEE